MTFEKDFKKINSTRCVALSTN